MALVLFSSEREGEGGLLQVYIVIRNRWVNSIPTVHCIIFTLRFGIWPDLFHMDLPNQQLRPSCNSIDLTGFSITFHTNKLISKQIRPCTASHRWVVPLLIFNRKTKRNSVLIFILDMLTPNTASMNCVNRQQEQRLSEHVISVARKTGTREHGQNLNK